MIFALVYLLACLSLILVSTNEFLTLYGYMVYLPILVYIIKKTIDKGMGILFLLRPDSLLLLYLNINYFFGHYFLSNKIYPDFGSIIKWDDFHYIENMSVVMLFILVCNVLVILIQSTTLGKVSQSYDAIKTWTVNQSNFRVFGTLIFVIGIFYSYSLELTYFGGQGSYSIVPMSVVAIYAFYYLIGRSNVYRYIIYVLILSLFALINYESKREVFYLLIPILLLEAASGGLKKVFSFKSYVIIVFTLLFSSYLILAMTVSRGFGQYNIKNPIESFKLATNLLDEIELLPLISYLSETSTFTHTSYKSISLFNDEFEPLMGSTYYKILFIPIPRSIYPEKPLSATSIYTRIEYPEFYSAGGSYPVSLYSEAFMNFKIYGFLVVVLIIIILNRLYDSMIKVIKNREGVIQIVGYIYAASVLPGFFRGYGLDLYLIYVVIGFTLALFISLLVRINISKGDG